VRQFHPVVTIKQIFAKNDVEFFPEMSRNQVEARKTSNNAKGEHLHGERQ